MSESSLFLVGIRYVFQGGLWRDSYWSRRGWIFTCRYYSPCGWRVPKFIFDRRWQYDASGKSMSMQLSRLHGIPQACKRFWRLVRSDSACAQCLEPERPWRRMMWFPFSGSSAGAFICSERCWEAFEAKVTLDELDGEEFEGGYPWPSL